MTTDYSAYKIPLESGINDIPVAPSETNGCNGAYYIEKYNAFLDLLNENQYTTLITSPSPVNTAFTLNISNVTSLVILRHYNQLNIALLLANDFNHCTILNDTDFTIPIYNGSDTDLVFMSQFPADSQGNIGYVSYGLVAKSRLNIYLADDLLFLEGGILKIPYNS